MATNYTYDYYTSSGQEYTQYGNPLNQFGGHTYSTYAVPTIDALLQAITDRLNYLEVENRRLQEEIQKLYYNGEE